MSAPVSVSARTRRALALFLAVAALLAAGCGSRLPESDFGRRGAPAPAGTPLKVGIISSATSPVGGAAFTGPRDGARAYFDRLNRQEGLRGRKVEVVTCDDGGSGAGSTACVQRLLHKEKVFALVAGASLDYAGAPQVAKAKVPDIGGQPVGPEYETYPHLYGIYGSLAPREGDEPGWGGTLYGAPRSTATSGASGERAGPPSSPTTSPPPPPTRGWWRAG